MGLTEAGLFLSAASVIALVGIYYRKLLLMVVASVAALPYGIVREAPVGWIYVGVEWLLIWSIYTLYWFIRDRRETLTDAPPNS